MNAHSCLTVQLVFLTLLLAGCGDAKEAAIRSVLVEDARLATVREQHAESAPKEAVLNYVDSMGQIDMSGCPEEFKRAFLKHRTAWSQLILFIEKYEGFWGGVNSFLEGLGGDAHYGEEKLEKISKAIQDTWTEVELSASRYGINANSPEE